MPESYELLNAATARIRAATARNELPDDDTIAQAANLSTVIWVLRHDQLRRSMARYPSPEETLTPEEIPADTDHGRQPEDHSYEIAQAAAFAREQEIIRLYCGTAEDAIAALREMLWLAKREMSEWHHFNPDDFIEGLGRGDMVGPWAWSSFREAVKTHRRRQSSAGGERATLIVTEPPPKAAPPSAGTPKRC